MVKGRTIGSMRRPRGPMGRCGQPINSIVPTALGNGNVVLGATLVVGGGVLRSTDQGDSFVRISGGAGTGLAPGDGVSGGRAVARGVGQLRHAQASPRAHVTVAPSPVCAALCPNQFQLVESGRALVQRTYQQAYPSWLLWECGRVTSRD